MTGLIVFGVFVLTYALIYGILALGLNIQYGLAGQANFGFVALFAAGAFGAAIAVLPPMGSPEYQGPYVIGLGLPWGAGLLAGAVAGGLLALLMGLVCLRLGGLYLAIVSFALAQIFASFLGNEAWLTGGQIGISPIPQPFQDAVSSPHTYLYLYLAVTAVIAILCLWAVERATKSPFGRVLRGVREDEIAARSLGKSPGPFKVKAFVFGGVLAGIAGAVWVGSIGAVHVDQFVPIVTFDIWLAMLLGGVGNNKGVFVGALVFAIIYQGTRFLADVPGLSDLVAAFPGLLPHLRFVLIGLLLILVVRFAPRGVVPERLRLRNAAPRTGQHTTEPAASKERR